MSAHLPTIEDYLQPALLLKRNRERRQELQKMMRLLCSYIPDLDRDDEALLAQMEAEYRRLGKERLPLTRQALGVWPIQKAQ